MSQLQQQIAAKYAPFFAGDVVGDAELARAEQIAQQILLGAELSQKQSGPSVIDKAVELIEPLLPQDLTQEQFDIVGNTELRVLIDCASIVVALREKEKGKPFSNARLDEMMIVAMQALCDARQELEANEPKRGSLGR